MFHAITIYRCCCFTTDCALNCIIVDHGCHCQNMQTSGLPRAGTCVEKYCLKSYFTWPRGSVCGTGSTTEDDFSKRRKIILTSGITQNSICQRYVPTVTNTPLSHMSYKNLITVLSLFSPFLVNTRASIFYSCVFAFAYDVVFILYSIPFIVFCMFQYT